MKIQAAVFLFLGKNLASWPATIFKLQTFNSMATRPKPIWSLNAMPETPENAATPTDAAQTPEAAATADAASQAPEAAETTDAASQAPDAAQTETRPLRQTVVVPPQKPEFPAPATDADLLTKTIDAETVRNANLALGSACNVPHETMRTRVLEIGGYSIDVARKLIKDANNNEVDATQLKHRYADAQEFCKVKRNEIKALRKPAEAAAPTE